MQRVRGCLVELVGDHRGQRVALVEDAVAEDRVVADHDRHRDRLADRPAQAEHRAADDPAPRVGKHRGADHLPAGRAEGQRGLLLVGRHGGEDLAADRADDRQDHDRQDEPGDEVVGAGDVVGRDEGDEVEGVGEPLLGRFQLRDQEVEGPEAVDDRGHGGQEVDQDRQRAANAPRAELGQEEGDRDGDRHPDQQRQRRGDQRPDDQRQGAVDRFGDVPVVVEDEAEDAEFFEDQLRFDRELDEEVGEEDEDRGGERRSARSAGRDREDGRGASDPEIARPPHRCVPASTLYFPQLSRPSTFDRLAVALRGRRPSPARLSAVRARVRRSRVFRPPAGLRRARSRGR